LKHNGLTGSMDESVPVATTLRWNRSSLLTPTENRARNAN
jgi:hypothetical protein